MNLFFNTNNTVGSVGDLTPVLAQFCLHRNTTNSLQCFNVKMFNCGQYKHLCKAHITDKTN